MIRLLKALLVLTLDFGPRTLDNFFPTSDTIVSIVALNRRGSNARILK